MDFGLLAINKVFSNKLQEEQVNGELECLVLASDGLWDVVENEVMTITKICSSVKFFEADSCLCALNESIALLFALG